MYHPSCIASVAGFGTKHLLIMVALHWMTSPNPIKPMRMRWQGQVDDDEMMWTMRWWWQENENETIRTMYIESHGNGLQILSCNQTMAYILHMVCNALLCICVSYVITFIHYLSCVNRTFWMIQQDHWSTTMTHHILKEAIDMLHSCCTWLIWRKVQEEKCCLPLAGRPNGRAS